MKIDTDKLSKDEQVYLELRELYEKFGYKPYRVQNFEEYSLYLDNKSFLSTENVLTFNDRNGKLLALKPDVTLSIVKNAKPCSGVNEKLYYRENVYRYDKSSHEYREIEQIGLEVIGDIDLLSTVEVCSMAIAGFEAIDNDFILDLSHVGVISCLLDKSGVSQSAKSEILGCIRAKNTHDLKRIATNAQMKEKYIDALCSIITLVGSCENVLEKAHSIIKALPDNEKMCCAIAELKEIYSVLSRSGYAEKINIDFSMMNDLDYYNGIIFQGYVKRVPRPVLTGGRYDKLLEKFGKNKGAMGFAIYLSELAFYYNNSEEKSIDVLIIYSASCDPEAIYNKAMVYRSKGKSVLCERKIPQGLKYKSIITF